MKNRKDLTVPVPGEVDELIEQELSYGDSKAGWVREAILQRLEREGVDVERFREGNPSDQPAIAMAD